MNPTRHISRRTMLVASAIAWLVALGFAISAEADRLAENKDGWVGVITGLNVDTSMSVPLLLLAPLAWWGTLRDSKPNKDTAATTSACPIIIALTLSVLTGGAAFFASRSVADTPVLEEKTFGQLPPAYHDEYSYLFQAHTFLSGRTKYIPTVPEGVFDQMHVMNTKGVFASRYFPATGLYMAPFVSMKQPYLGHHLANAFIAAMFCFAACRSGGWLAGLITGTAIAAAPGMAIFSNLLVAHHPTLVGLSIFVVAILEARRRAPLSLGLISGLGLAFAMLARPMSAAGFAMPFGIWVLITMLKSSEHKTRFRRIACGLAIALAIGFATLGSYNYSVTGSVTQTPYQIYTDIYTPNHVFGFDNVERGSKVDTPKRIARYDGWAENLTPALAIQNAKNRLHASFSWTLGLVPTLLLGVFSVLTFGWLRTESRLALASVVTLHLAHVPYWYEGIMHYHYVFESGVMWCLLAGLVIADLRAAGVLNKKAMTWLTLCAMVALAPSWVELPNPMIDGGKLFPKTRIASEVDGISFSRIRYQRFQEQLQSLNQPALVLVKHDEADIHLEYVNNPPSLDTPILTGHLDAFEHASNNDRLFPDRTIYHFDARKAGRPDAFKLWRGPTN